MSIDLTVTNTKNNTSSNSNSQGLTKVATIYQNTDATLTVTLVNNTGSSINLAGTKVTIQLPNFLKGSTGMTVSSKPTGYGTASIDSDKAEITIPYSGNGTWNTGSSNEQTFTIENITTSSQVPKQPELMTVVTAGDNFATVNVVLTPPKTKGNIDLSSVIDVSLQSDQILVSDVENPLPYPNKLELTFSNLTTEALALEKTKSTGATVTVSFVVGNTEACLAKQYNSVDKDKGSIEKITVTNKGTSWGTNNPYHGASGNPPSKGKNVSDSKKKTTPPLQMSKDWVLTAKGDCLLGGQASGSSSVTFTFDNIYSFTPVGTTLMYVYFQGFWKTDKVAYTDQYFVLPIKKGSITPILTDLKITPQVVKYNPDGTMNTQITPSWKLIPPTGKHKDDVKMSIKVTSTKNKVNNRISPITHSQNGQPLNLLTYCTWTKDLSNEEGIDVEIIASVTDTNLAKLKEK